MGQESELIMDSKKHITPSNIYIYIYNLLVIVYTYIICIIIII